MRPARGLPPARANGNAWVTLGPHDKVDLAQNPILKTVEEINGGLRLLVERIFAHISDDPTISVTGASLTVPLRKIRSAIVSSTDDGC